MNVFETLAQNKLCECVAKKHLKKEKKTLTLAAKGHLFI